jgi:hypothetical protein
VYHCSEISGGSYPLWLEVASDAFAMDESELYSAVNALFVLAGMPRRWSFLKKFLVPLIHQKTSVIHHSRAFILSWSTVSEDFQIIFATHRHAKTHAKNTKQLAEFILPVRKRITFCQN